MPQWLRDAVFYEIYPQSFLDTDADGIGDLQGIIDKLDYIRELGCNALWINPCFQSPFYDAGYDVSDYKKIAPRYGSNDDMRRLLEQAHRRGIRVLLDLVAGHTSIEHPWFRQSMQLAQNEYTGRYVWADDVWEDFADVGGVIGSIRGFCNRGACATNFFSTQPALNYGFASPDPQKPWQQGVDSQDAVATFEAMADVMRFWLDMGCDGFRVDMAHSLVKSDPDQQATIALWRRYRALLDRAYPDAALIAEWGIPERALAAGFHMDFVLHFGPSHYLDLFREAPYFSKQAEGDIARFIQKYMDGLVAAGGTGLVCIPSGNHDMPRIARCLDPEELKVAFAFLLSMPGAPFIYYGDEIGMRYLQDAEPVEGGYERTGARSPMQWDRGANAGFSAAPPDRLYIPIDPDPGRPDVETQMADPSSLYSEVKRLIALRRQYPALGNFSAFRPLLLQPGPQPFVYLRGEGAESVVVALNPFGSPATLDLDALRGRKLLYQVGGQPDPQGDKWELAPCSAALFINE